MGAFHLLTSLGIPVPAVGDKGMSPSFFERSYPCQSALNAISAKIKLRLQAKILGSLLCVLAVKEALWFLIQTNPYR